jgi:addiction module HigA family antidote
MLPANRRPTHPGEILYYEFLEPLKISPAQLSSFIGISEFQIKEIIDGKRPVTTDTAFRLSRFFGNTPQFWIGLQTDIDLWDTLQSHVAEYEMIHPICANTYNISEL